MTGLVLRRPRTDDGDVMMRMHEQLAAEDFELLPAEGGWQQHLALIEREAAGDDLAEGRVRADFLLAEVDGEIVGRVSIRHALTPFLREVGGHVGYAVAPEHRRRGYATAMLQASVEWLAELGVDRVLVTCDVDNVASATVIERCGGELEDVRRTPDGVERRRFWITSR